jgi:hypothetical protein
METAGTPPQVLVLAMSVKGEVTCAPFTGVVTVMAAAGTVIAAAARRAESKIFIDVPRVRTGKHELEGGLLRR